MSEAAFMLPGIGCLRCSKNEIPMLSLAVSWDCATYSGRPESNTNRNLLSSEIADNSDVIAESLEVGG